MRAHSIGSYIPDAPAPLHNLYEVLNETMAAHDNPRVWEALAKEEPYWAVVTSEKFRKQHLTDDTIREFFKTGIDDVEFVRQTIRRHLSPEFEPNSILDFGCGVGRLLIPLAEGTERAVGIDVSDAMLEEARANCHRRGLTQVQLLNVEKADLSTLAPFDLVHSYIVFQHVLPERGEALFRSLLALIKPKGIGVLHFTYAAKDRRSPWRRSIARALRRWRRRFAPATQIYEYDLNRLFVTLQKDGVTHVHVEMTDHDVYGVILFFQKG